MTLVERWALLLMQLLATWLQLGSERLWRFLAVLKTWTTVAVSPGASDGAGGGLEAWQTDLACRTYTCGGAATVRVQTSVYIFHVDLEKMSGCSDYFQALSHSNMRETAENLVLLEHIPSTAFRNLLEFTFLQRFLVTEEDLGENIEVGCYLMARPFITRCLVSLAGVLTPQNCRAYLDLSQEICCEEMRDTVYAYLSQNLLEMPWLTKSMGLEMVANLTRLRSRGTRRLCALRKECLVSGDPELHAARQLYVLVGSEEDGDWCQETAIPFLADKWCFTTAVLYNYLYLIGGYRQKTKRGYEFKMVSFRYNPFTHSWVATAPLIKHRRHFSTAVCEGSIFALGGWYLDSLVAPDSSTALYTAVERYDPWEDNWAFVAPMPLTDFHFTMSLSHDIPLVASLGQSIYVIGTIQRTGETLVLQYNVQKDCWSEMLPTLTRADMEIPILYFLGATEQLHVIGGNNAENVFMSFCVDSGQWDRARSAEKMALAGQGTVLRNNVYMPAIERNAIVRIDLRSLTVHSLPSPPITTSYESLFHLYF